MTRQNYLHWEKSTVSPDETRQLGARLGAIARAGDVYCLEGDLGAGKTCFTQGLGQGLEIRDAIHSPTFVLAHEHRGGRLPLYHLDVYRIRSAAEAIGFGFEDYVEGDGVLVVEWADKILDALPQDRLWISFKHTGENTREIIFEAYGEKYMQLLDALQPHPVPPHTKGRVKEG